MRFKTASSPHATPTNSVNIVMRKVLLAMIPGSLATIYFFGWGVLVNMLLATLVALTCEALMLSIRKRPIRPYLTDGSAILTACLLALALPQLAPWWLTVIATAFAIIVAKHLYGGLGFNPFNPAMVGYVVAIISFPKEMTQWAPPLIEGYQQLNFSQTLQLIFTGSLPLGVSWDSISMATPLDTLKTQLGLELSINDDSPPCQLRPYVQQHQWRWLGLDQWSIPYRRPVVNLCPGYRLADSRRCTGSTVYPV